MRRKIGELVVIEGSWIVEVVPVSVRSVNVDIGRQERRTALAHATMRVTAAIGYEAATITDIAEVAGCSRRAFNRHFRDKGSAFEVGYREITRDVRQAVQRAYDAHDTPMRRTWACLEALAGFLAEDPRRAELLVIHGHAAGPDVVEIRVETMRRLVGLILDNTRGLPRSTADPRLVAEIVAGGIFETAFAWTLRGRAQALPGFVPQWTRIVAAPYVAIVAGAPVGTPRS